MEKTHREPYRVRVTWSDGEREGSFWITMHRPSQKQHKKPEKREKKR